MFIKIQNYPKRPYWQPCGFVKENSKTIWVYVHRFKRHYLKIKKSRVKNWVEPDVKK